MKLLIKQRFFSWADSYDIYNEAGETVYVVKGEIAFGHLLRIYDACGNELGTVREKLLTWLPKFEIYLGQQYLGCIRKEFTLITPKFTVEYNGWQVRGNWVEWDYEILNDLGQEVARINKEFWNWTDTYALDIRDSRDALGVLMLVLAIDAEKCSRMD